MSERHRFDVRVYYEDTDAAGIVYHANYLKFAERARTEMLRALGLDQETLARCCGVRFVVRRCRAEFLAPARLDDRLTVETAIRRIRGARMWLQHEVWAAGRHVAELEVEIVAIDANMRPVRMARVPILAPLAAAAGDAAEVRRGEDPEWIR
ncbi:Acyl-CoA thioester hydrolase YbgC [bacterium HR40]|nr:Acyl-CoA thioester hydrolase YbgC [bacterium HR40]